MSRKDAKAITDYLAGFGLDASVIREAGADETGYFQMETTPEGRPLYDPEFIGQMKYLLTRHEWPSEDVWPGLEALLQGKPLPEPTLTANDKVDEPKPEPVEETPKVEKPKNPGPRGKETTKPKTETE